ncbi:hypothetical protein CcaverHIS631_0607460 [Cutaneotrichosporon cavernicola]|nr:hypothetical protein CcaverHIS631_0607460 [Cutaneotrichosporon cavernicola]
MDTHQKRAASPTHEEQAVELDVIPSLRPKRRRVASASPRDVKVEGGNRQTLDQSTDPGTTHEPHDQGDQDTSAVGEGTGAGRALNRSASSAEFLRGHILDALKDKELVDQLADSLAKRLASKGFNNLVNKITEDISDYFDPAFRRLDDLGHRSEEAVRNLRSDLRADNNRLRLALSAGLVSNMKSVDRLMREVVTAFEWAQEKIQALEMEVAELKKKDETDSSSSDEDDDNSVGGKEINLRPPSWPWPNLSAPTASFSAHDSESDSDKSGISSDLDDSGADSLDSGTEDSDSDSDSDSGTEDSDSDSDSDSDHSNGPFSYSDCGLGSTATPGRWTSTLVMKKSHSTGQWICFLRGSGPAVDLSPAMPVWESVSVRFVLRVLLGLTQPGSRFPETGMVARVAHVFVYNDPHVPQISDLIRGQTYQELEQGDELRLPIEARVVGVWRRGRWDVWRPR